MKEEPKDWFADAIPFIDKALKLKQKMIKRGLEKKTCSANCPTCGGKDTMRIQLVWQYNNHLRAWCTNCPMQMME